MSNEEIEVKEGENLYELYFIKDVLRARYGEFDYSNYGIRVHIPSELYKKFQMIADYIDISMIDLLRYIIFKFVEYAEDNNLFPEIKDELHLRRVLLKRKHGAPREIRIAELPKDEVESAIVNIARKILSSKYKYRIIDEDGNISQNLLFKK